MGLKYFSKYTDVYGNGREIRFFKEDYDDPAIEWINGYGAVVFTAGTSDSFFPDQPIITFQARINLIFKERYDLSEFVFNRKTFFCQVIDTDVNRVHWSGWLEPWDASHDYARPPYQVSLTASCGLAHLARKKYKSPDTTFKKTGLKLIQECLAIIESNFPFRLSTHIVENSFSGADLLGLTSFEQDISRYYNQNGEAMMCAEIVNDILNHFNAELVQWDNKWVIRSVVDNSTGMASDYIDIDPVGVPLAWPRTYAVNSTDSLSLDGSRISILPPITKYRTEVDLGTQLPFFPNGNMAIWSEAGLAGWDFTHMNKSTTDGWEQFVIGVDDGQSVLKINGKSPQPYRKRKKKSLFKRLTNIAINIAIAGTGAVGALTNKGLLKGKWEDIEPTQYIETSGGTIGKGDRSVTISFDYETEAFSSFILISIRIPVTMADGKIVNYWVDPSTHVALAGADKTTAGSTDQFCLIKIDPVDMGSLTDKGTLDVSANANYPAANFVPGSKSINWTWTVTGVPAGEYRKIGGVNGVLVENGDLIIARIPNGGGTQEAVGDSWEVISMRNNTRKGTFSLPVAISTNFVTTAGNVFPADKIYVRFYKMADDSGLPGDWYKIYNLNGALEGFVANEESGKYATTLERGNVTDEEAETIQLISGDYNPWYSGSWTKPGSIENTNSWRRRPNLTESLSIYRAMMLDRLCMTSRALLIFEGRIKVLPEKNPISYLHNLAFNDQGSKRFRIVRYSYNDYLREAEVTAIEVKYEEIPASELRQDSYIPGSRQLNTVPGQGDGIYPSKQDSTNGRLSAEDIPLSDNEIVDLIEASGRMAALFEGIPPLIFTAGEISTDSIDLNQYLSELLLLDEENYEEEDRYDFNSLKWETYDKPSWVSSQKVVFLNVSVTGKPVYTGNYSITFRVRETPEDPEEGEETEEEAATIDSFIEITIPIQVYPKTIITYELLDTSGDTPVVVGTLPGVWPLPAKWDIREKIKGQHDWWQMTLFGGGETGNEEPRTVNRAVTATDLGIYLMFEETDGIVTEAGQYRHFTTTQLSEVTLSRQNMVFTLYDDTFLANGRFYLRKGGVNIGEISLDGTSIFENPEGCDIVFISSELEHDQVVLSLTTKAEAPIKDNTYSITDPDTVEEGEYAVFGEDTVLVNNKYTITASVLLDGAELITRFTDFELAKKKPEAEGGSLTLMEKVPGTLNFKPVAVLPKTGSEHAPIHSGFNIKVTGESPEFDWEGWDYQVVRGVLTTIDLSKYTKSPQFVDYPNPITESGLLIFGPKSSLDIGNIHEDITHRVIVTRRLGGASGELSAVLQADFSFGEFVDPDTVPDEDDEENSSKLVPRLALSSEILDYKEFLDVRVDGVTIEVKNPTNEAENFLQVKEKGILFKHIQDVPTKTLIGKLTAGSGRPYAVSVIDVLSLAGDDTIPTGTAVKDYIDELIEGSIDGTADFIPRFDSTGHALINSAMKQKTGNIGVGLAIGVDPTESLHVDGNVLSTKRFISTVATGTAPLGVLSTTLVQNLHADLLNKSVIAGVGMSGGGIMTQDRTLNVVFGNAAGTVAQGNDPRFDVAVAGAERWIGQPTEFGSINNIKTSGVGTWGSTAGGPTTFGSTLTFVGNSASGDAATGAFVHQILGTTIGDWYVRYGSGATPSWGSMYQLWTSKQFTATQITHWDTAYSWGDHSIVGYALAADYVANFTTGLNWNTAHLDGKHKLHGSSTNSPTGFYHNGMTVTSSDGTNAASLAFRNGFGFFKTVEAGVVGSWIQFADRAWVDAKQIIAGVGLTGGGDFSVSRTVSMGTPSQITQSSTNSASGSTHSHAIDKANLLAGTNVSLSASGTGVLLGNTNITVNVSSVPWNTGVSGKPTTISGFGIVDAPTISDLTTGLAGKENNFSKGDIIQGSGLSITGSTLLNKLVGIDDITFALATSGVGTGTYKSVTVDIFGRVTAGTNPTSLAGFGITDTYTSNQVDTLLAGKANSSHTHTSSQITDFASAGRALISGTGSISYNSTTGAISFTGTSGVTGSGFTGYFAYWNSSGTIAGSTIQFTSGNIDTQTGGVITSFIGVNASSLYACAAIQINSTDQGILLSRMTSAQRSAIANPQPGLIVYQTDVGAGGAGIKLYLVNQWVHIPWDLPA